MECGLMITNLTFSLINVSGFREVEVLEQAHRRMKTIFIGSSTAFAICTLIFPIRTGTNLRNLNANSVEKLVYLLPFGFYRSSADEAIRILNGVQLAGQNVRHSHGDLILQTNRIPPLGLFNLSGMQQWEQVATGGMRLKILTCTEMELKILICFYHGYVGYGNHAMPQ